MAEALLRQRLAERAPSVSIGSVGQLFDGRSAEDGAVHAMKQRGIDLTAHRSRVQTLDLLADTSLILTMERMHVREIAMLSPELFGRTFTLPEFVGLATETGPRPSNEPLRTWVERVGADRNPMDQLSSDPKAEVADPMGRSRRAFKACATELDDHLARLADLAWPLSPTQPDLAVTTIGEPHADRHRR